MEDLNSCAWLFNRNPNKSKRIQRGFIVVNNTKLQITIAYPRSEPRGLLFVPPLIGGSAQQQIIFFKHLVNRGFQLVTFQYRGHGASEGVFSIRNAIRDTEKIVELLAELNIARLPVYGIADCFGALPLFAAVRENPGFFRGIGLANPIYSLRQIASPIDAISMHIKALDSYLPSAVLDVSAVLRAATDTLLPGVDHSHEHFGILRYERADTCSVVKSFLFDRAETSLKPLSVPTIIVYSERDALLGLHIPGKLFEYKEKLNQVLLNVEYSDVPDADHFFAGKYHEVNRRFDDFFSGLAHDHQSLDNRVA